MPEEEKNLSTFNLKKVLVEKVSAVIMESMPEKNIKEFIRQCVDNEFEPIIKEEVKTQLKVLLAEKVGSILMNDQSTREFDERGQQMVGNIAKDIAPKIMQSAFHGFSQWIVEQMQQNFGNMIQRY